MGVRIGYGFDACDLSAENMVSFIGRYGQSYIPALCRGVLGPDHRQVHDFGELDASEMAEVADSLDPLFLIGKTSLMEVICHEINDREGCGILSTTATFILFESLRFEGEEKRGARIRSARDFEDLIMKYFPDADICFGDVMAGLDSDELNLYI